MVVPIPVARNHFVYPKKRKKIPKKNVLYRVSENDQHL
jgi:hypothetical protein